MPGTICKTSNERGAFGLVVSRGCPYNRCAFCDLYKGTSYHETPLEVVEAELKRVADVGGKPHNLMLGDGDALHMSMDRLNAILDLIETYVPSVTRITSDATISSIAKKTDEELRALRSRGYCMVYIGIESGLDDVLRFMHKDHTNQMAREQIARLHAAGFEFGAHIMTGVAGAGRGIENARATAALLNDLKPTYITNFNLGISPLTELGLMEEDGLFVRADDLESLREERELVNLLTIETTFEGYHNKHTHSGEQIAAGDGPAWQRAITQWIHTKAKLPDKRDKIIRELDASIAVLSQVHDGAEIRVEGAHTLVGV
ncbi:MAG: radical SAM protein [Atopobiaceae bacterium]|jgi:radical SAM superfamily enzyme YgiQ (UPF0313 family)